MLADYSPQCNVELLVLVITLSETYTLKLNFARGLSVVAIGCHARSYPEHTYMEGAVCLWRRPCSTTALQLMTVSQYLAVLGRFVNNDWRKTSWCWSALQW